MSDLLIEETARQLCIMRGLNPDDLVQPEDTHLPPVLSFPHPRWRMLLPKAGTAVMAVTRAIVVTAAGAV
jgi:hypothetical protein